MNAAKIIELNSFEDQAELLEVFLIEAIARGVFDPRAAARRENLYKGYLNLLLLSDHHGFEHRVRNYNKSLSDFLKACVSQGWLTHEPKTHMFYPTANLRQLIHNLKKGISYA